MANIFFSGDQHLTSTSLPFVLRALTILTLISLTRKIDWKFAKFVFPYCHGQFWKSERRTCYVIVFKNVPCTFPPISFLQWPSLYMLSMSERTKGIIWFNVLVLECNRSSLKHTKNPFAIAAESLATMELKIYIYIYMYNHMKEWDVKNTTSLCYQFRPMGSVTCLIFSSRYPIDSESVRLVLQSPSPKSNLKWPIKRK